MLVLQVVSESTGGQYLQFTRIQARGTDISFHFVEHIRITTLSRGICQQHQKDPLQAKKNPHKLIKVHSPQSITKIVALVHNNTLSFALDLLGANLQHTDKTNLLLALSLDSNNLPSLNSVLGIRQSTPRGGKTGSHKRCARQHESNGTAVDLDCRDGRGVLVDEAEMRDGRSVDRLEEERC